LRERDKLLCRVRVTLFQLKEAELFLDTHPDSSDAVAYYQRVRREAGEAIAAYEEAVGPLSAAHGVKDGKWVWDECPWPWMMEA